MKKLMALCLALLMALSMCTFTVMAEEEAVDFSAIANGQPQNFVTSDLSLGENVITSSNEVVIALDGTVTRPIYEDATVSLTINGGEAINVVVKAKTVDVLYANDFSTEAGSEWSLPVPEGNTASSVKDGALHVIIGATTVARTWNYYYPAELTSDGVVGFEFDMSNITDLASAGADIRISGNRYDAEDNQIGRFDTVTVARCDTVNGFGAYWMSKASKSVSIKYDPTTGDYYGNGVLKDGKNLITCTDSGFSYNEGKTAEDCAKVVITQIGITNAAGGCTATFDVDNFVQYQEISAEDALANATDAEKLANYSKYLDKAYVANGENLDALATNLKFTADEELPAGVTLEWISDSDAVADDGTLNRAVFSTKTATITGTLTVGEESITKTYDVTLLPLTIGGQSEVVDFDSYDLADGVAIEEDGWTVSSSEASITNVVDNGNSYARVSSTLSGGTSKVITYSFNNVPASSDARYYIMSFDYKVATPIANVINVGLRINGKEVAEFVNRSTMLHGQDWATGQAWYGGSTTGYITPPTEFVNLQIVVDIAKNTVSYIADGNTKSTVACPEVDFTNIESADLYVDWRAASGAFDIDNIEIYAENTLEGVLATLNDAGKVDFYKQLIEASDIGAADAAGTAINLDAGYEAYDPATYGVEVSWASDNLAYIANDGTVNKLAPHGTTATVNMTATITAGSASDTVIIPVAVGSETTLIDSVDYDDTSVSVGNAAYGTDDEYGSIVTMTNPTEGTHKASGTLTSLTGAGRYDRVIFEADMKYTDDGASFASGGICLKTIAGKNGVTVYLNYTTGKVQLTTTKASVNSAASGLTASSSYTIYYPIPQSVLAKGEGAWVHLMVDHNVLSQTYNVYLDGILVNEVPILQSDMDLGENGGSAIRGYSLELSGKGTVCVDNLELYKYSDANAVEVNAALNAALIQFASDIQSPVLVNQELPAMTIGRSWVTGSKFNRDLNEGALKPTNVATYTYVTDGPQLTYAINGEEVTAVDVTVPAEVELTITAAANGITESKTVTRKVAPVAIQSLALGTASCLNGAWVQGADGTEKLIIAKYLDSKFVGMEVVDFADTAEYDSKTGTGDRFDEVNGLVHDLSTNNPNVAAEYDQIKIFVMKANGISPAAHADKSLKE